MLKPSSARYSSSPAALRYSVTTSDPGARLVLTHGFTLRPRLTALRATRPAPIMTLGFDVLVQLVMAATTTDPCVSPSIPGTTPRALATATAEGAAPGALSSPCFSATLPAASAFGLRSAIMPSRACWNLYFAWRSDTRSCGRFGPARLGSTVERSRSHVVVYTGSVEVLFQNRPCSLAYASTRWTCAASRPVRRR